MHLQYLQVEIYEIICRRRIEFFTDQITKLSFVFALLLLCVTKCNIWSPAREDFTNPVSYQHMRLASHMGTKMQKNVRLNNANYKIEM